MGHCDNIILQVDISALFNKLFQWLAFILMLMIQIHESVCLEYQVDEYYPEEFSNKLLFYILQNKKRGIALKNSDSVCILNIK